MDNDKRWLIIYDYDNLKKMIQQEITKTLKEIAGVKEVKLDVPDISEHGDYSTNVAMVLAKKEDKDPRVVGSEIVDKLQKVEEISEMIDKIEVAGPGFINFYLSNKTLIGTARKVLDEKGKYGSSDIGKGNVVIVEYSSPNIAKPFTVGHLRSTVIGDAVANLLEATGWTVLRDNHLGDWGTQFGKQIYAIKAWGDEEKIEKSDNPVKELVGLYVKFHQKAERDKTLDDRAREWFKKLEDGNPEAKRLWEKCVEWSWKEFERIYEVLGVHFNKEFDGGRGLSESFFEDKMDVVIKELEEKEFLKEGEEGAKLVFFENDKYPPAMILKKDGATLYHTRDLATDKYRLSNYKPDLVINEVGAEQALYFQQLYEMERMLGWYKDGQRVHISHGLIRFKDRKMSTRKGNVVWLEDVLDQAIERAKDLGSETDDLAMTVGVGAIKYNDLKRDPKTEIVLDWDEMLSMEGNSGPYLQYTYARTQSVFRKAGLKTEDLKLNNLESLVPSLKLNNEELSVLRSFVHFPEVVQSAAENYAPNLICNYLHDLAQRYNTFYNKHSILDPTLKGHSLQDDEVVTKKKQNDIDKETVEKVKNFRLALTFATGQIIKNGLELLGIKAPEKM